jgi:hypothetical protein
MEIHKEQCSSMMNYFGIPSKNFVFYTDYNIQMLHLQESLKSNPWLWDFLFLQLISQNKSDT